MLSILKRPLFPLVVFLHSQTLSTSVFISFVIHMPSPFFRGQNHVIEKLNDLPKFTDHFSSLILILELPSN